MRAGDDGKYSVFTWSPFLFFQHNQKYDTLLPIAPCTHKLKAGIAYCFGIFVTLLTHIIIIKIKQWRS
jgi:hypothetical protein